MTAAAIIQSLLTLAGGGAIVAIINGLFNKNNLGANATKLITEAAGGLAASQQKLVEGQQETINALTRRVVALEQHVEDLEEDKARHRTVLQEHAAGDHVIMEMLKVAYPGVALPEFPPLYPAPAAIGGNE